MTGILSSTVGCAWFPDSSGLLLIKLVGLPVFVAFLVWEFRSWYRLRKIPGPFLASVSVLWQLKKAVGGTYHEHLNDVARKYGKHSFPVSLSWTSFAKDRTSDSMAWNVHKQQDHADNRR